jgi:hypothetical protein
MSTEQMIMRLASRGLLPCEHNLMIWECVGDGQWGVSVDASCHAYRAEAYGGSLREALENLMRAVNRTADLPAASPRKS